MTENNYNTTLSTKETVNVDAGLRAYMLGVYNSMATGVAVTGLVAYLVHMLAVSEQTGLTSLGVFLYTSPFAYVLMFLPLVLSFAFAFSINRVSLFAANALFYAYAVAFGLSLSVIFLIYTNTSIAQTFFVTAAAFGALSLYGYTTKKDLGPIGTFLVMGMFGLIIASVVNLFLQSSVFHWAISAMGVIIFAGLTAYDTQKIKEMYDVNDPAEVASRKSILGAYQLYTDFVALFTYLLQFLGNRE